MINPFPPSLSVPSPSPIPPPPPSRCCFCRSGDSRSSRSRRRRSSLRSFSITGRLCSFHTLDELGVIDCDPTAARKLEPEEGGEHDHEDDDEGNDYEDGLHAREEGGLGGLLWKRERVEGEGEVDTYFAVGLVKWRKLFEMDVKGWGWLWFVRGWF